jgi:hypothetical protein
VVVVNVVVDDDAVVIWRRLGRKSSPSLREITDEEDEELICWEDLENKEVAMTAFKNVVYKFSRPQI